VNLRPPQAVLMGLNSSCFRRRLKPAPGEGNRPRGPGSTGSTSKASTAAARSTDTTTTTDVCHQNACHNNA